MTESKEKKIMSMWIFGVKNSGLFVRFGEETKYIYIN